MILIIGIAGGCSSATKTSNVKETRTHDRGQESPPITKYPKAPKGPYEASGQQQSQKQQEPDLDDVFGYDPKEAVSHASALTTIDLRQAFSSAPSEVKVNAKLDRDITEPKNDGEVIPLQAPKVVRADSQQVAPSTTPLGAQQNPSLSRTENPTPPRPSDKDWSWPWFLNLCAEKTERGWYINISILIPLILWRAFRTKNNYVDRLFRILERLFVSISGLIDRFSGHLSYTRKQLDFNVKLSETKPDSSDGPISRVNPIVTTTQTGSSSTNFSAAVDPTFGSIPGSTIPAIIETQFILPQRVESAVTPAFPRLIKRTKKNRSNPVAERTG